VFVTRAVQDQGGVRTFGVVTDHDNGTYTAQLNIHWNGATSVYVTLMSTIENVCPGLQAIYKYGHQGFAFRYTHVLRAIFRKRGSPDASTVCWPIHNIKNKSELCYFNRLNDNFLGTARSLFRKAFHAVAY